MHIRRVLQWGSGITVLLAAISFSFLTYWDFHIKDLEKDADKLLKFNQRMRTELDRSVDEYNRAFITSQHIHLLEIHNANDSIIQQSKRDLEMQIKGSIIILASQSAVFGLSKQQIQNMLAPLKTYTELFPIFYEYSLNIVQYMHKQSEEYNLKSEHIAVQQRTKSIIYPITVIINSLGLATAFLVGPIQRK